MGRRSKAKKQRLAAAANSSHTGRPSGRAKLPPVPSEPAPVLRRGRSDRRPAPPKRRCRRDAAPAASDPVHLPTDYDKRAIAVGKFLGLQDAASQRGTRVSGADVAAIAKSIRVSATQLRNLARRCAVRSLARLPGSGRPPLLKQIPGLTDWFLETSRELGGMWTVRMMAAKMEERWGVGSIGTICKLARSLGFCSVRQRFCPFLTAEHKQLRRDWCTKQGDRPFSDPGTVYVHVDEKWFFAHRLNQRVWVRRGEEQRAIPLQSKSHITKVMFLAAIAKPVPEQGFDGRIGLYPIAELRPAARRSSNRPKGTNEWHSLPMNATRFKEMLKANVVPDVLRLTGEWVQRVVIQMDNAGGHGGGRADISTTTLRELNSWARDLPQQLKDLCPQGPPKIEFIAQPPKSPDLNVLDLGIWTSLQVAVDNVKNQKGLVSPTVSELVECCQSAWAAWPAMEKLTKIWQTLENILSYVAEANGGNDYKLLHAKERNQWF